jgi:hypothetical protein
MFHAGNFDDGSTLLAPESTGKCALNKHSGGDVGGVSGPQGKLLEARIRMQPF